MKCVISSTYDNLYFYFIPITTFSWNKLGVDVICFIPLPETKEEQDKLNLVKDVIAIRNLSIQFHTFISPEHKKPTYSQCARLYGACLDLVGNEGLVLGDVDMMVFKYPPYFEGSFTILGGDLTPLEQYPVCYISANVNKWRDAFGLHNVTYQQALDNLLGHIECDGFRGNYWGKDQEVLYQVIKEHQPNIIPRSNGISSFAQNRIDRDDTYYLKDLNPNTIDAHLWRPGYTQGNFPKIVGLMEYFYPDEDLGWLYEYTKSYNKLFIK